MTRLAVQFLVATFATMTVWAPTASADGCGGAPVLFEWRTVGDPGNPSDPDINWDGATGFGSVGYTYHISKYEITNAQYLAFLNAVAAEGDLNQLYSPGMNGINGGIVQDEDEDGFLYSITGGRGDMPVVAVSFWNALRFANWLHNGQPCGSQDDTTTEDGAYTFASHTVAANRVSRNPSAARFLPNEHEWYKAAYYDTTTDTWYDHAAGSDDPLVCAAPEAPGGCAEDASPAADEAISADAVGCTLPTGPTNTANCNYIVGDVTAVGSYPDTLSPNGTLDQGGNVWEWTETADGADRIQRGGDFLFAATFVAANIRFGVDPDMGGFSMGFRIARRVPANVPAVPPIAIGLLAVWLGIAGRRKLRS